MTIKYYMHNAYFLVAFNCTYPRCGLRHQGLDVNGDYRCGVNVYVQQTNLKFYAVCPLHDSKMPPLKDVLSVDWKSNLSMEEVALLKLSSMWEDLTLDIPSALGI